MRPLMIFAEYLALRSADQPSEPDLGQAPVAERSIMRGLFKAVNPARPLSPTNPRLLSGPGQERFKSQVVGR